MRIIIGISVIAAVLITVLYSCSEDKWNEKTRQDFIETCMKEGITESSCECILEKIEEKEFTPSSLHSEDEEVKKAYEDAMRTCLGL